MWYDNYKKCDNIRDFEFTRELNEKQSSQIASAKKYEIDDAQALTNNVIRMMTVNSDFAAQNRDQCITTLRNINKNFTNFFGQETLKQAIQTIKQLTEELKKSPFNEEISKKIEKLTSTLKESLRNNEGSEINEQIKEISSKKYIWAQAELSNKSKVEKLSKKIASEKNQEGFLNRCGEVKALFEALNKSHPGFIQDPLRKEIWNSCKFYLENYKHKPTAADPKINVANEGAYLSRKLNQYLSNLQEKNRRIEKLPLELKMMSRILEEVIKKRQELTDKVKTISTQLTQSIEKLSQHVTVTETKLNLREKLKKENASRDVALLCSDGKNTKRIEIHSVLLQNSDFLKTLMSFEATATKDANRKEKEIKKAEEIKTQASQSAATASAATVIQKPASAIATKQKEIDLTGFHPNAVEAFCDLLYGNKESISLPLPEFKQLQQLADFFGLNNDIKKHLEIPNEARLNKDSQIRTRDILKLAPTISLRTHLINPDFTIHCKDGTIASSSTLISLTEINPLLTDSERKSKELNLQQFPKEKVELFLDFIATGNISSTMEDLLWLIQISESLGFSTGKKVLVHQLGHLFFSSFDRERYNPVDLLLYYFQFIHKPQQQSKPAAPLSLEIDIKEQDEIRRNKCYPAESLANILFNWIPKFEADSTQKSIKKRKVLFQSLEKMIKQNDKDTKAKIALSNCFNHGVGTEIDTVKGIKLLDQAVDQKDPEAYWRLGEHYYYGLYVAKDEKLGLDLIQRGASLAEANALAILATIEKTKPELAKRALELGSPIALANTSDKDPNFKARIFEAIDMGNREAMFNISKLYKDSIPDEIHALTHAAQLGNIAACLRLGKIYAEGKKGEEGEVLLQQDLKLSLKYYKFAADAHNEEAQSIVGFKYRLGEGTEVNYGLAFEYSSAAAEAGNLLAEHNLARLYELGIDQQARGIRPDLKKAFHHYQVAAQKKFPKSIAVMGGIYNPSVKAKDYEALRKANNLQTNVATAINFYREAITLGEPKAFDELKKIANDTALPREARIEAQMFMVNVNEKGIGPLKKNINYSIDWLVEAAKLGHEPAMKLLLEYESKQNNYALEKLGNLYNPLFKTKDWEDFRKAQNIRPDEFAAIKHYRNAVILGNETVIPYLRNLANDNTIDLDARRETQLFFAEACEKGLGSIQQNLDYSFDWIVEGAKLGTPKAIDKLCDLADKGNYKAQEELKNLIIRLTENAMVGDESNLKALERIALNGNRQAINVLKAAYNNSIDRANMETIILQFKAAAEKNEQSAKEASDLLFTIAGLKDKNSFNRNEKFSSRQLKTRQDACLALVDIFAKQNRAPGFYQDANFWRAMAAFYGHAESKQILEKEGGQNNFNGPFYIALLQSKGIKNQEEPNPSLAAANIKKALENFKGGNFSVPELLKFLLNVSPELYHATCYIMGEFYSTGQKGLVDRNYLEAARCYLAAAKAGYKDAKLKLESLAALTESRDIQRLLSSLH